jgi:hypothetical protein
MFSDRLPPAERYRPFVYVFVPFALILAIGNLVYSELSPSALLGQFFYPDETAHFPAAITNFTLGRVAFSIQLCFLFALPALTLFTLYHLPTAPPLVYRYWQLFWSFGFVAYAIHAYYSTIVWFGRDWSQIVERQGLIVVITNYVLLAAWAVDVLVSVFGGQGAGGKRFYQLQWLTHGLFVIAVVVAAIVFGAGRSLEAQILGWVIAVSFAYCLFWRIVCGPLNRGRTEATGFRPNF